MKAPPAPETVMKSVTIPPPSIAAIQGPSLNGRSVVSNYCTQIPGPGAQNPTPNSLDGQPGLWVYFILKSGGNTIGPQTVTFTVQENLINYKAYLVPRTDSGWIPAFPSTSYYYGNPPQSMDFAICDFKTFTRDSQGNTQLGQIGNYTQKNQISWQDSNGTNVTETLESDDWTFGGTTTANGPGWFVGYQPTP